MATIPDRIDQIDVDWVRAHTGWQVEAVEIEPMGAGVGFIGRLGRLHLAGPDVEAGVAPGRAIAKLPTDDPGGRVMGQMMRMWEREHRFYADVAHRLDVRVPAAYVNLYDESDGVPHAVLVLEDLHPLRPGDQVAGATADEARLVVDRLAALHAQWWDHAWLDELDWMPSILDPMVEAVVPMFQAGWPGFCDRYRGTLAERTFGWAERFVSLIPTWLGNYREDPRTIAHGDARLDNMFFGDGDDPASSFALVDWQMAMRSPGGGDLAYFVMTDLDVDTRRAHERDLIDAYGDSLLRYGAPAAHVDTDRLWRGYLEGVLFYCVGMGSSLLTLDPANQRGLDLIDALVTRVFTAADDLDVGEIVLPLYE